MSTKKKVQGWTARIEDNVGRLLEGAKFQKAPGGRVAGRAIQTWERRVSWRLERIYLIDERPGGFTIGVELKVPTTTDDGEPIDCRVDGYNAHWLSRKSSTWYETPASDPAEAKVISLVLKDLKASLKWAEKHYGTPRAALQMLASSDRNGCGVGTPVHGRVVEALRKWSKA